jgi:DNA-binding LacI/PurR family transcriptional regulator
VVCVAQNPQVRALAEMSKTTLRSTRANRKPNIAFVARRAKVAKSTVSRVLNGGYASPEVRARVLKVIEKLDYTPWSTARNFSLGRTGCFGLVVEDTQGEWLPQILGGIDEEIGTRHISLLLGSVIYNGRYDSTTIKVWIRERRVDGLIFAHAGREEAELIEAAKESGIGLVLIAPDQAFPGVTVLRSRNADAAHGVAKHLVELGHRRVAFVGGPSGSVDTRERLKGLEKGLRERKIPLPSSSISFSAAYSIKDGVAYAEKWLKLDRGRAPTAVVLANDSLALGFMRTVLAAGVRIPKDVSVVGFDDIPSAGLVFPALTTARQRLRDIGASASRSLLKQLESPDASSTPTHFPMELVVRESTGPAPKR